MKKLVEIITVIAIAIIAVFVNGLAYSMLWNDVVLNIWQLFSSGDIINTMHLSYGACVAIAVGIGLIRTPKSESEDTMDSIRIAIGAIITKLVWIGVVALTVAIVF